MINKNRLNVVPADTGSITGLFEFVFDEKMKRVQTLAPAKIISYDRGSNRAQVQLMIKTVGTSGELIDGAQIASIPVMCLGGGGSFISFNLQTGDLGWVFASDRDIALFVQSLSASPPSVDTFRNFSSSFFIPDAMKTYSASGDGITISDTSGANNIQVNSSGVTITSTQVTINGNVFVNGSVLATGDILAHV